MGQKLGIGIRVVRTLCLTRLARSVMAISTPPQPAWFSIQISPVRFGPDTQKKHSSARTKEEHPQSCSAQIQSTCYHVKTESQR